MSGLVTRLILMFAIIAVSPLHRAAKGQQVAVPRARVQELLRNPGNVERVRAGQSDTTLASQAVVTMIPGMVLVPHVDTARPVRPAGDSGVGIDPHEGTHAHLFEFITLDVNLRPRRLAVTAEPQGGGLRYDGQWFRGAVYLGIEDPDHPGEVVTFAPVALQVFSYADRINPERIQVRRTMIPTERIMLEAAAPGAHVPLFVWVDGQHGRTEYQVPVMRSRLQVESTAREPQGLGLDEAEVTVTVPEDVRADLVQVRLSARGVRVPPILTLRPGIPESFSIRTKGLGIDTIHVTGPGFLEAGYVDVDLKFPLAFLLAALCGGLAGAIGGRFWRKRRHKAAWSLWAELGAGLAGGLVVAVVYTLGVNLTPLPVTGPPVEAVVFVIAAVGSMLGLPALLTMSGSEGAASG